MKLSIEEHRSLNQPIHTQDNPMRLIVVIDMVEGDSSQVLSIAAQVIEEFCVLDRTEWKRENGVAVFQGIATLPLSVCSKLLHENAVTAARVRSIDYREAKAHGAMREIS